MQQNVSTFIDIRYSILITIITRAEPYDPYIPNATTGNSSKQPQETAKTARVQQQVDEVVGIMQENIDKVMQRGERLDDLRGKTGISQEILISITAI